MVVHYLSFICMTWRRCLPARPRKASLLENGHEPHETVTRRIRIHWVCLDNRGAVRSGMLDGGLDDALRNPLTSQPSQHEEARNRPDAVVIAVSDESPIGGPRGHRAPCHRLTIQGSSSPIGSPGRYPFRDSRLAARPPCFASAGVALQSMHQHSSAALSKRRSKSAHRRVFTRKRETVESSVISPPMLEPTKLKCVRLNCVKGNTFSCDR